MKKWYTLSLTNAAQLDRFIVHIAQSGIRHEVNNMVSFYNNKVEVYATPAEVKTLREWIRSDNKRRAL